MKVTIVAVVEVDGDHSPDELHARTHRALEGAGVSPIFVAARAGAFGPAIVVADQMMGAAIPAEHHIPHSTAALPESE